MRANQPLSSNYGFEGQQHRDGTRHDKFGKKKHCGADDGLVPNGYKWSAAWNGGWTTKYAKKHRGRPLMCQTQQFTGGKFHPLVRCGTKSQWETYYKNHKDD